MTALGTLDRGDEFEIWWPSGHIVIRTLEPGWPAPEKMQTRNEVGDGMVWLRLRGPREEGKRAVYVIDEKGGKP